VYAINDNRGEDYRFARAGSYPGWISADLVDDARQRARLNLPAYDPSSIRRVALGAKWVTDTLLVSMTAIPGLSFDPRRTPERSTWFSYGFLLREAATRLLDIQSQELRVGVHGRLVEGHPTGELFLADSLANGAGYSSYLARADVFPRLIAEVDGFVDDVLRAEAHSAQCTTSCYDCLRSFENMSYHPLLDWRLARDLHELLKGGQIDRGQWAELEASAIEDLVRNFDAVPMSLAGSMVGATIRGRAILLTHPLEATDDQMSERLALATATAEREVGNGNVRYASLFDAMRRPSWVVAQCLSS
jgi:hypothetical protein